MKIIPHFPSERRRQGGSAVIVLLAFLAIIVMLTAANTRTINALRAEVRLTDQREVKRLAASVAAPPVSAATNAVSNPTP